jgi:hypothetical protein
VAKAEAMLIGWAAEFDPRQLKSLADRILSHIAPEIDEAADAAALARQQARAFESRTLSISRPVDGRVRPTGWLDTAAAAIVSTALDPPCAPRTTGAPRDHATADDRTPGPAPRGRPGRGLPAGPEHR